MAVAETTQTSVDDVIEQWEARSDCLIEMLHDVQTAENHLPREAMQRISERTGIPMATIYSVATFYNAFSLTPRGRHCVGVCMGTPCHVKGAPHVLGALERQLGIRNGQTDPERNFTLMTTGCVGTCGLAPVVVIDDDMYGNVKQAQLPRILKRYRDNGSPE